VCVRATCVSVALGSPVSHWIAGAAHQTRGDARKDYDWSKDVATIKLPTLLVFGDADAVRTAHAVQLFELLGGGKRDAGWDGSGMSNARLAILPGLTRYTIFSSPALASTVTPFLDDPMPRMN